MNIKLLADGYDIEERKRKDAMLDREIERLDKQIRNTEALFIKLRGSFQCMYNPSKFNWIIHSLLQKHDY